MSALPFFPCNMKRDCAAELRAADRVHVGGGNTVGAMVLGEGDAAPRPLPTRLLLG